MQAFKRIPPKNQSTPVGIQNKVFFWHVLGLFRLFLRCSWLVLGLFRLFLACSWVDQVVLGLFRGVPSFSNDEISNQKADCPHFLERHIRTTLPAHYLAVDEKLKSKTN